jgi:hypothetical protein
MADIPLDSKIPAACLQRRKSSDLTVAQRQLVEVMSQCQFGRVENLPIQAGEPVFGRGVNIVRVARLGGAVGGTHVPAAKFELKKCVCDLFTELDQVGNGLVVRLEFRSGVPCLLEISSMPSFESPSSGSPNL